MMSFKSDLYSKQKCVHCERIVDDPLDPDEDIGMGCWISFDGLIEALPVCNECYHEAFNLLESKRENEN